LLRHLLLAALKVFTEELKYLLVVLHFQLLHHLDIHSLASLLPRLYQGPSRRKLAVVVLLV